MDGKERARPPDAAIGALARRQHGVVAKRQLREIGLGRGAIEHRLRSGRLLRVHRGVYAVGHDLLTIRGRWMAGVLACGLGALLSHRGAAALWGLANGGWVEVTSPRRCGTGPAGVHRHESATLISDDATTKDGIPVTAVPRTLVDLAEVAPRSEVERAFERAERADLLDLPDLHATCARNHGRRGLATLLSLLAQHDGALDTRSELERRFVAFCRMQGLPLPAANAVVCGFVVDALWPRQKLIVELDGFEWHKTRAAFEEDRRRDATLTAAGYRVLRITWRRLEQDAAAISADIRSLLGVTVS